MVSENIIVKTWFKQKYNGDQIFTIRKHISHFDRIVKSTTEDRKEHSLRM